MRYDAVVFDNDGVLTTPTEFEVLERAMEAAYEDVGVTSPTDDHLEGLLRPDVTALCDLAAEHDVEPETLWEARERAAIDAQLGEIREGRKTLYDDVSSIESLARPRAIVSNNQHETVGNIVDHFGLDGFDPWYGREPTLEGIERKKPTPYYLEQTIDEMGATEPLYVGDTWVDVAVADALGIDSAFIWRDHRDGYDLGEYGVEPDHEIDSLEELLEL